MNERKKINTHLPILVNGPNYLKLLEMETKYLEIEVIRKNINVLYASIS